MASFSPGNSRSEPKIHRRRGKKQRGEWRIPCAVKNIARYYQKIFPRVPGTDAPVRGHDDRKKDYEGERVEKHRRPAIAYLRRHAAASTFFSIISRSDSNPAIKSKIESLCQRASFQARHFAFAATSLFTSALVVFSKRIPHALSTVSVATAMSRNIQIGCSRMRSPSQMT